MESTESRRGTAVSQGAAGRVVAVHRQTRRGLAQAVAFTGAAVVAALVPHETGMWLPLHLFVLGGLLTAISSTTQMMAVTWSASRATPDVVATSQRWGLAAGTVLLCVGRETGSERLVEGGGVVVVLSVAAMIPILLVIRRHAVTQRFAPAIEAYVVALAFGVVGTTVGIVVATGRATARWGQLRDVHLTLNVFGLIGLVIAGTLPYFSATVARRKMSPRATPVVVRIIVATLAVATVASAVGRWRAQALTTSAGLVAYAVGLTVVAAILPVYGRRQLEWAGPRLIQLVAGIAWWSVSAIVMAFVVHRGGDERNVLTALVVGGFAQILVASLAYLGPVLRGGGHESLTAGFAITRSWVSLVAGNAAAVGAMVDLPWLLAGALVVWVVDVSARGVVLVVRGSGAGAAELF